MKKYFLVCTVEGGDATMQIYIPKLLTKNSIFQVQVIIKTRNCKFCMTSSSVLKISFLFTELSVFIYRKKNNYLKLNKIRVRI